MSRSPIDISDNLRVFQKVNPSVSPIEETGRWQQFAARMRDAIEQNRRFEQLPKTDVLFREMSGSPMTSWVLHKPANFPSFPFSITTK